MQWTTVTASQAVVTDVHDDPVSVQSTAPDRLNTSIGGGTSRSFRIRRRNRRIRGKTSFARDGSRCRLHADDFAFHELSVFQFHDMG